MDTVHDHIWDAVNAHLGTKRPFVPGAGRAARHHALRPPAARGRHLLRLRPDSLRGGPARLRRLCLRPQPGGLHAHLGCLQHCRRLQGKPRGSWHRTSRNLCDKCRRRSTNLASRPTARAGGPRSFSIVSKSRCPQTGWMVPLLPTLDCKQEPPRRLPNWCRMIKTKRYDIAIRSGVSRRGTGESRSTRHRWT